MKMKYMIVAAAVLLTACDSELVTNPVASIDSETALKTVRGIELAVTGAYRSLQSGSREYTAYPDLYADNLDFTGTFGTDAEVGLRNVSNSNGAFLTLWADCYDGINRANGVLEAISDVSDLTSAQEAEFKGAALFVRAVQYFRLVEWYGGVPLVLEPSKGVTEESLVSRNSREEVLAQVVQDLTDAASILPAGRVDGKATKGAANALLAKVYLEQGDYGQARDKANTLISDPTYSLLADFADNFNTEFGSESIYEIQFTVNNANSLAFWYFPTTQDGRLGFSPTEELYNLYGPTDTRRDASIHIDGTTRYCFKYSTISTGTDNVILARLAEMYLIRAEANARLGAADATVLADINTIRARAGATPVSASGQAALLDAVLAERRLELAFEGMRFFDLRRFGQAQTKLAIDADHLLFPIPQGERDTNPNLTQNPGY